MTQGTPPDVSKRGELPLERGYVHDGIVSGRTVLGGDGIVRRIFVVGFQSKRWHASST
jgi:hypothetical protein